MSRFTAQYGRSGHVGTHGPCVRPARLTSKQVDEHSELQALSDVGTHGSCVRSNAVDE